MAKKKRLSPEYIFEASWEVCNKIGGIYTVLSTKAYTLQAHFNDRLYFIGPDIRPGEPNADFIEDNTLLTAWKQHATEKDRLNLRIGRWNIPGKPIVILVDFRPLFEIKNDLYSQMWQRFEVDSLQACGDYDEACMFACAAGMVTESFYLFHQLHNSPVIAHFNEWMLGMGALYLRNRLPRIGTIFTTHATSIGRSIAGNNKPLYAYFSQYDGNRMAMELNMQSKHSLEKQTALHVDCFTTVSEITANECKQLLGKAPDIVTPNGFEDHFIPRDRAYLSKRDKAKKKMLQVANRLTGSSFDQDTLMIAISGRYEYKNKGIDLFIESMNRLRLSIPETKQAIAFILVPAWNKGVRTDLHERLKQRKQSTTPLPEPYFTHELVEPDRDKVFGYLRFLQFLNHPDDRVKIIFVPSYLKGDDGIFNLSYYDLLTGLDLTIFPSYYEPWGYTPLESIAFGIPTLTTNLAGFGMWAEHACGIDRLSKGVGILERSDENYFEVADKIKNNVLTYMQLSDEKKTKISQAAIRLADRASWSHFIEYYLDAYDIALKNKEFELVENS
ncbi:MAG: glycosyltransferase [Dysgonamonadaceae bacterium]|jgi:glycosyltransferase involved in cell wall biosynthesis|nr:glycosyltransferase [Dysgonamonadaceae bacterium]